MNRKKKVHTDVWTTNRSSQGEGEDREQQIWDGLSKEGMTIDFERQARITEQQQQKKKALKKTK